MRELVFDESENVASVLVCLMESLIREDSIFLQQYEKQLTEIETLLLDGVPENFCCNNPAAPQGSNGAAWLLCTAGEHV